MPAAPPAYEHDHENEVTLFAETNFRNRRVPFGIKTDDRRRHVYVIGKTGMGKTTLLENMVLSDIAAGHGVAYIDPHGDTAQKILDFIPPHRINDVVYLNPADMDFPVGFNILESINPDKKHLVAAGLMGVFKKIWPDVWSARMEYILLNTILALLDAPGSTLLGINRLLVDEDYRKRVVSLIQDPVVKTFWVKEFAAFSEKYRTEAIAPVQNKVGQFLSASIIRNIVAQVKSTIDIREIMDQRKILILNLAKGLIGEENSRLLGGMIVTRLQLAAMERVDMPEKDRQDFYLYVDEFQNFATTSFANILSEARKYRLNLIVAHQYIEQLTTKGDTDIRDAIFGNVGTIVAFRVGAADADFMETEFAPRFTPEDLVNLGKYDIYLKLMIDGASSEPFSATTLPPIAKRTGSLEKVVKVSRERNARPRQDIEDKVLRWSGMGTVDAGAVIDTAEEEGEMDQAELTEKIKALEASSPKIAGPELKESKKKAKFEIPCSVCGQMSQLTFEPDWSRPWFCKDHLAEREKLLAATGSAKPTVVSASRPAAVAPPPVRIVVAPPTIKVQPSRPPAIKIQPDRLPVSRPIAAASTPASAPPALSRASAKGGSASGGEGTVEPVSLSALFGKPLPEGPELEIVEEEGEATDETEEEKPAEELEIKSVGAVGLVEIGAHGHKKDEAPRSPVAPTKPMRFAPPAAPRLEPKSSSLHQLKPHAVSPKPERRLGQDRPSHSPVRPAVPPPRPLKTAPPPVSDRRPESSSVMTAKSTEPKPAPATPPAPPPARPAAGAKKIRPGQVIKF